MNCIKVLQQYYSKYKNIVNMILIAFICLAVFTIIYIKRVNPISESKTYTSLLNEESNKDIGEITSSVNVEQTFVVEESMSGLSLKFTTFKRENTGKLNIKLVDDKNKDEIQRWTINASDIEDNTFYNLKLDNPIDGLSKDKFSIHISTDDGASGNALSLLASNRDAYKGGELYINGVNQDYDICIITHSSNANFINVIYSISALLLTVFLISIYYMIFVKRLRIERIFLVSILVIGLGYIFLITPYSTYDESAHIETAYRYSNDILGLGHSTESGGMLRRAEDVPHGLSHGPTTISTYRTVYDNIFSTAEDKSLIETGGRNVAEVPYVYLPQIIAITVARVLSLGQVPLLLLGRIFNLIAFATIVYFAIKKIPFAKMVLFTIALLPMTIHQVASFSYDSIMIALSCFFIAYCLYIAYSKEERKKIDYILLFISAVLLAPLKFVYILICSLCLIIPRKKIANRKKYYMYIGGLLICALAFAAVAKLSVAIGSITDTNPTAVFSEEVAYTIGDIIRQPMLFIKVLLNSFRVSGMHFVSLMVSGFYMVKIHSVFTIVFIVLLILSAIKERKEEMYLTKLSKIWMFLISLGVLLLLHIIGFTWTAYGDMVIQGVQGRYMLPVLPLIILLFRNSNLVYEKNINKQLMFATCSFQVMVICNAFLSILVNNS